MARTSPERQPDQLVRELELDDVPVCTACLGIVAFALDHGDPRRARRELNGMTPILWEEGLAEPALAAVRAARGRGVAGAAAALAELEARGGRTATARAIVRRLAEELARETRTALRLHDLARDRLERAPPGLN